MEIEDGNSKRNRESGGGCGRRKDKALQGCFKRVLFFCRMEMTNCCVNRKINNETDRCESADILLE